MYRKLTCLIIFILVLRMSSSALADLVAHLSFNENSGNIAYDTSGNGNNGTLNGDPQWVAGQIGSALEFDGNGDYVEIPRVVQDDFTLAAWIKTDTPGLSLGTEGYQGSGLIWSDVAGEANDFILAVLGTKLSFFCGNPDTSLNSDKDIVTGQWVHVTATRSAQDGQIGIYINGIPEKTLAHSNNGPLNALNTIAIGGNVLDSRYYTGLIDDVRIYDHVLSQDEILDAMEGEPWPYAYGPTPADGALYADIWVSLSWIGGDYTVSHDVYLGDNFDDVNDGTRDSEVFRGNVTDTYYLAGIFGYAYPDGLVPGTTYYWRIDEVNETEPNSPWKGPVWSFAVPPKTAYSPVPSNGAKFIDVEGTTLSWTAGFGTRLHYVYFGDDYDTVANATGASNSGFTTYSTGPLEIEKTYYWKVDESDGVNMYTGDVWSFTTAKAGGGLQAEYYHWSGDFPPENPFQVFVTKEIVPEINWNWGDLGSPNPLVNVDDFSCRFTGEVEAAFTETYTFYMTTDDGQRLWIDSQPIIDMWVQQGMTEYQGTIDLVAGQRYSIEAWMYEHEVGAGCELRWSSPSTPKQIIPQAALSPPVRAMGPNPSNGATGTKMTPALKWNAGIYAASHEVYFGTDPNAVANADKNSPEYKGSKALGEEIYEPGKLAWHTQYFWRIDEVNDLNPDSPWIGSVWSFTTGDFLVIDDFEDYDIGNNEIWWSWKDGLGYAAHGNEPAYSGNGTGSAVGDETTMSYTEETIVHSGSQSMPLAYDNNKQDYSKYSETELMLISPRDWTEEDVAELSIWFRGYPASTGSFAEGPVGTYTMTASGTDITGTSDEFHYAYKMLSSAGSIIAKVQSVDNTNEWAKAGVMIRETLDADSAHAMTFVTPGQGVAFEYRPSTGADNVGAAGQQTGITVPYWVKIDRSISGLFSASLSADGTTWQTLGTPQTIPMATNIYIGLALTAHDATLTCEAVFSNVTTTGNVTGQWAHQDIGILSNDAEPLYVAVSNSTGAPAIMIHNNPSAAQIDTWTEWVITLSAFADQGIDLTNIDKIALGLGDRNNPQPGGSGKMFFDDIRLYRPREAAE